MIANLGKDSVHMLWVYGELTQLERICAKSFIKNGFSLNIWTYGKDNINIDGANIRDARNVLPESEIFLNQAGSYAGFSDLFRYCVLSLYGGLYSDTDVIAVRNFKEIPSGDFFVTERLSRDNPEKVTLNGNVISYRNLRENSIIEKAKKYAYDFPKSEMRWGEIGPHLLTQLVNENSNNGFKIYPPNFANPLNHWDCPEIFISGKLNELPKDCFFVHLYNEMWRRKNIDKNNIFSLDTLYGKFIQIFE